MLYQDQLAVVSDLSGPGRLWPFALLQLLLTADLAVRFPTRKTLVVVEEEKMPAC